MLFLNISPVRKLYLAGAKSVLHYSIGFALLFAPLFTAAAIVQVHTDRDPVRLNESFQIIFDVDEQSNASPDFSPLQTDFEILGNTQSSNVRMINGKVSSQTQWVLTVMAKKSGQLTIPSIRIGQHHSLAKTLTVTEKNQSTPNANGNSQLFFEVEAVPSSTYVQAQIIYTVRFFYSTKVRLESLTKPEIEGGEALVEQLGEDKSFETRRGERRYGVFERRYAIFPQKSGKLTIKPMMISLQVTNTSRNWFDPFGQSSPVKRIVSDSVEIDVAPVPAQMQGKNWLPANQVELVEDWSVDKFIVGEPVTRTLTLKASGLTAAQLPAFMAKDIDGFKTYPDQPELQNTVNTQGVVGMRREKIALVPVRAGKLILPALTVPWWNVKTGKMETALLPQREITVAAAAQAPAPLTPPTQALTEKEQSIKAPIAEKPVVVMEENTKPWQWLSLFLAAGWLLTLFYLFARKKDAKPLSNGGDSRVTNPAKRAALKTLKQACKNNQALPIKNALLAWARLYWKETPPHNIREIGKRLGSNVESELEKLNVALYHDGTPVQNGEALWLTLSSALKKTGTENKHPAHSLPSLYPG